MRAAELDSRLERIEAMTRDDDETYIEVLYVPMDDSKPKAMMLVKLPPPYYDGGNSIHCESAEDLRRAQQIFCFTDEMYKSIVDKMDWNNDSQPDNVQRKTSQDGSNRAGL